MPTYDIEITRDGSWWMIHIPAVDGLTQAHHPGEMLHHLMSDAYAGSTRGMQAKEQMRRVQRLIRAGAVRRGAHPGSRRLSLLWVHPQAQTETPHCVVHAAFRRSDTNRARPAPNGLGAVFQSCP